MRRSRGTLTTAAVSLLLLSACAGTATADGTPAPGGDPGAALGTPSGGTVPPGDTLTLRVRQTGGLAGTPMYETRLPMVSVYADGRVVTQGPQVAVYPGPALPNVVLQQLDPAQVRTLVDKAVAAGVRSGVDLGRPTISDGTTTRFTVRTDAGEQTVDAYALTEAAGAAGGLTAAQQAARKRLAALLDELTDVPGTLGVSPPPEQKYVPGALAAVVRPYRAGADPATSAQPAVAWPGPALPGPSAGPQPGTGCVTVSGAAVAPVLAAAKGATTMTPWTSGGEQWSVALRPLLPDEPDCEALRKAA